MDVVKAVAGPMGSAGAAFYFDPETVARSKELGLDGFRFYVLGRGGVLGDVPSSVVESAFGYFHPALIDKMWSSAKERMDPAAAAAEYLECAAALGRRKLSELPSLEGYCQAAEKVIAAVQPAALPLFAATAATPVPEDLPARALHLTAVLRELRGSVHLVAVVAVGLDHVVAHAIRRPNDVEMFGHPEAPDIADADRAKLDAADAMTDELMAIHYSVLNEAESTSIVEGANAIAEALA
jgi:hypothetical protein